MADELNSLVYTIQNFMYIGCAYSKHWPRAQTSQVCHSGATWPYALLASLPPLSRLIQCVKRYYDSGLYIHLINAGKYCSSILTACLFVYWRSQDKPFEGAPFVVWVIFATVSSFYTSAWVGSAQSKLEGAADGTGPRGRLESLAPRMPRSPP